MITKYQEDDTVKFNFNNIPFYLAYTPSDTNQPTSFSASLEEQVEIFILFPQYFDIRPLIEKKILAKDDKNESKITHNFYGFNPDNCNN